MLSFPNCKINLGLYITRRREDGYHDLETVFYPVNLKDVLEIVPAKQATELHISGRLISGAMDNNLIWQAYQKMKTRFPDKIPSLDIYLHKLIPMGAGLGGGSADGAFMLRLVNDYCKLQLSETELAEYALELGSDCPFFIYNTPQFATGRGEQMKPLNIDLTGYTIQIVCPAVHISTAKAFQLIAPKPSDFDMNRLPEMPVCEWKDHIRNDFEAPVFAAYPELSDIRQQLYNQGALFASMSGSGSAIYGIFPSGNKATIRTDIETEIFTL